MLRIDPVPPWFETRWQQLAPVLPRLPHGLLLHGPEGIGKRRLALNLVRTLLCENAAPTGDDCRGCGLLASGSHPDFHFLTFEAQALAGDTTLGGYAARHVPASDRKPRRAIVIDQIRSVINALATRGSRHTHRVVLIDPADRMNMNAANALLKILEEPPTRTSFILVSSAPYRLPATVQSRCSLLECTAPDTAAALAWLRTLLPDTADLATALRLAGGAPLHALELIEADVVSRVSGMIDDLDALVAGRTDPVRITAAWLPQGFDWCLYWLQSLLADLAKLATVPTAADLRMAEHQQHLGKLARRIGIQRIFSSYDAASRDRRDADGVLDERLLLEGLLAGIAPQ